MDYPIPREQFPIGMGILAVDDDPICLKLLDTLLTRCQYHVTVTKNAIKALNMLRENKDKFDLVISDVVMPEMDGFKLLELVGLEMDLPVIMLSGNDDPKMVMKGISNGACDYLRKPIRIEELKNIWQHVVRKNKIVSMELNKTTNQDMHNSAICNAVESETTADSDQNGKSTRKRNGRDGDEDDGDADDESSDDNEDSSTRKKARVVWSVELHRKFVSAVNQLGIDRAIPKKILDLMNVENLTRGNVASHLQKYRLYLKRISCAENGQANMVAALGSTDLSYLRLFSMSHVGHFQTMSSSGQFHNNNAAFRSFPTSAMIGRFNTPSSLFGTDQLGHAQNLNNNINNDQLKFHSAFGRGYQNDVQGIPTSVSLVQIPKVSISSAPSPIFGISNNSLVLEANPLEDTQEKSEFPFSMMDTGSCSDIWSSDVHSSRPSSYPQSECFRQAPTDNITPSITSLLNQCPDSLTNVHSQGNDISFQWWDDHNPDAATYHSNVIGSSMNSPSPMNGAIDSHGHNSTNSTLNRNLDFNVYDPLQMNQLKSQNTCIPSNLGSLEDLVIEMMKKGQAMYGHKVIARIMEHSGYPENNIA